MRKDDILNKLLQCVCGNVQEKCNLQANCTKKERFFIQK